MKYNLTQLWLVILQVKWNFEHYIYDEDNDGNGNVALSCKYSRNAFTNRLRVSMHVWTASCAEKKPRRYSHKRDIRING